MVSPQERWKLNITEPTGLELFEAIPEIRDIFIRGEWFEFICAFNRHHTGVALLFVHNFDGFQTQLGDTTIHITEHFIVGVCALRLVVRDGLKRENCQLKSATSFWWQNTKTLIGVRASQLCGLKKSGGAFSLHFKGISWEKVDSQSSHCYHLRFLMHLNGDKELNLPFYFLKRLTKMSKRVQNYPESAHRSLYHQGFIKILVLFALNEIEIPWKYFLESLGLQEEGQEVDP
jgi:hypothetical protein